MNVLLGGAFRTRVDAVSLISTIKAVVPAITELITGYTITLTLQLRYPIYKNKIHV